MKDIPLPEIDGASRAAVRQEIHKTPLETPFSRLGDLAMRHASNLIERVRTPYRGALNELDRRLADGWLKKMARDEILREEKRPPLYSPAKEEQSQTPLPGTNASDESL